MSETREYLIVLGGLVAGSVACLVLSGVTWATAEITDVFGTEQVRIAGSELVPVAEAAGWLGLAAVVAILAARRIGRAVVGVLLSSAGLVVAGWAGYRTADLDTAAEAAATTDTLPTITGTAPAAAIGMAVAGVVIAVAGALTTVRGSRWPSMGRKYERPAEPGARSTSDTSASTRDAGGSAARDAWAALDRGDDPTTWLRDPERTGQNEADTTNGPGRPTRP